MGAGARPRIRRPPPNTTAEPTLTSYDTPHLPGLEHGRTATARDAGTDDTIVLPAVDALDWPAVAKELDSEGVAVTPPLLSPGDCEEVRALFDRDEVFRSTVDMGRHRFGSGRYRYFAAPLPPVVTALRRRLYPPLARIANQWAERLDRPRFPPTHAELTAACAAAGQLRPTPLLLRYGPDDYNCLHQDVYGELTFPLQVAIMLDRPDVDFTGGESVFVEQRPRAQSRPLVKRPGQGQALIFAVHDRPVRSARGWSRVMLRHGVSAVHDGERHVLGVIFHDAP
ncbi:2OG-Fe(II) oxygenase [Streptomyces roseolus]|uniref:2OG-Fe(II) oxygenase n=1 Tax=Streptomyces roseolus TaxID=67358 RepID=UPI0037A001CC